MPTVLARLVSYMFHPLLMATYLFFLLSLTFPAALYPIPMAAHSSIILMVFIITFILPVLNLGIFKAFGTIRSYHLHDRKERIIPFLFTAFIYVATTYMFYYRTKSLNENFIKLLLIIDALAVLAFVVTLFFKISVHSMGIWGIIGIMLPLNKLTDVTEIFYPTLGLILLAGVVMSSRLQLNEHSPREVMWGSVLGLATGIAGMLVLFA